MACGYPIPLKIRLSGASYSILGGLFCHRIRRTTRTFAPCFTILSDGLPKTYSCPFRRSFSLLYLMIFSLSGEHPVNYNFYFAVDILTFLNPFNCDAVVHFFHSGLMLRVPWKVTYLSCIPWNTKIFLFRFFNTFHTVVLWWWLLLIWPSNTTIC